MRGALITVEGVEGSGKSTQCRRLAAFLRGRNLEVVETSEPDGTPLGQAVRGLFELSPRPSPLTQAFLFLAARQEHVARVIQPALARGGWWCFPTATRTPRWPTRATGRGWISRPFTS